MPATVALRSYTRYSEGGSLIRLDVEADVTLDAFSATGFDDAADALDTATYTEGSAGPGDASGLKLTARKIAVDKDSSLVFRCTLTYDAKEPSRESRAPNAEVVEEDLGSQQITIYFDVDGNPIVEPKSGAGHGIPVPAPYNTTIVKRYHTIAFYWATLRAIIKSLEGKLNSAALSTPGGKSIAAAADIVLFAGAQMRPTSSTMCEVAYAFEEDGAVIHDGTDLVAVLHRHIQPIFDDDDEVESVELIDRHVQASMSTLMQNQ